MIRGTGLTLMIFSFLFSHAQITPPSKKKFAPSLQKIISETQSFDSITVSISLQPGTDGKLVKELGSVVQRYGSMYLVRLKISDLNSIAQSNQVIFISPRIAPKEELTTGATDLTLNRIRFAQSRYPQLNGAGLAVSVKERLFDTSDIDIKGRMIHTGLEPLPITAHASQMMTIIAGAGNSSPFAKGAAWNALVSSADFQNLFPEPDSMFQKHSLYLQNHSYGTVVENFYGNEAAAYDQQCNHLPTLLHVFSSGNSGDVTSNSGTYSGVQGMSNLTGNFKQAKNIITVGSVDSSAQVMPLSSKGPAYDGRIKPELVAYGEDGSSGASALVSGAALLVQDAYKRIHANLPSSSLVKSVLLNSAEDLGTKGPDYSTGFGNLNAYRALSAIEENRFIENTVLPGDINTLTLAVPDHVSKLKVTIAWNDPAAVPNSTKALVNDLDMQVQLNSTTSWNPWVLDPSKNSVSLQLPAQRGMDTLNNVEQITVDNPVAAVYTISINGSKLKSAQSFSLSWQMDTSHQFYWTFPSDSDPLICGKTYRLRWETNIAGQGSIEFNGGDGQWHSAGQVPDISKKFFEWTLPDTITRAVFRMKVQDTATFFFLSDSFSLSPQFNPSVGFNCVDSFLLYWNSGATRYRLYELNTEYLQSFLETADTMLLLHRNEHPSIYYSIAPIINGREGIRSNTLNYASEGVGCYIKSFYLQQQSGTAATFYAELGSLFQVASWTLEKLSSSGFVAVKTISSPQSLSTIFTDPSLTQGEGHYRLKIVLQNGREAYSTVETVYYLPVQPVLLYPNPVSVNGQLHLINNESGRYHAELYDASGRLLFQLDLNSSLYSFNKGFLLPGIYFVRIRDSKGPSFTQKLVVN
ncbi:MAG: S8 family peptidase [Flavisolibacter sp.]